MSLELGQLSFGETSSGVYTAVSIPSLTRARRLAKGKAVRCPKQKPASRVSRRRHPPHGQVNTGLDTWVDFFLDSKAHIKRVWCAPCLVCRKTGSRSDPPSAPWEAGPPWLSIYYVRASLMQSAPSPHTRQVASLSRPGPVSWPARPNTADIFFTRGTAAVYTKQ